MFPKWLKSPKTNSGNSKPKSPHFSSTSFKDINSVLKEDEPFRSYPSVFHRFKLSTSLLRSLSAKKAENGHHSDERVVLYFTSLRVVRKTFEDCKTVTSILHGYGVPIDGRDLSLDSDSVVELQRIVDRNEMKRSALPLVFIGGKYIGGGEEIKRLHECGELKKLIGRSPIIVGSSVCDICGGLRFVLCRECNGSHKIYCEKSGFRTCNECNVNGLVRCPSCGPGHHRMAYCFS
ncbi:putative LRR receptor-like serine/threonine-protein kinase MRH1-like [Hibiscus syriacus]|uniref:LRR receptor-like serine/threonine-protein kinase MRH1-like n=1 Tax=Hibiscus syriacus TaxID=106335 RepID=A0A6A3AYM3_HIBSY|nr:uncharacterized protein At3g28850-like [Hibiscus syriacus]KAE8708963.1 putative LRR receptor-like serine/threonine-protein kinase MRH1-like [Hibiscus syriacus]